MTTTFDPTLAMSSTGALPPSLEADIALSRLEGGLADERPSLLGSAARKASDAFERRPLVFVAAAAGAGALAGWLVRR
jgi:hypothetical protein